MATSSSTQDPPPLYAHTSPEGRTMPWRLPEIHDYSSQRQFSPYQNPHHFHQQPTGYPYLTENQTLAYHNLLPADSMNQQRFFTEHSDPNIGISATSGHPSLAWSSSQLPASRFHHNDLSAPGSWNYPFNPGPDISPYHPPYQRGSPIATPFPNMTPLRPHSHNIRAPKPQRSRPPFGQGDVRKSLHTDASGVISVYAPRYDLPVNCFLPPLLLVWSYADAHTANICSAGRAYKPAQ